MANIILPRRMGTHYSLNLGGAGDLDLGIHSNTTDGSTTFTDSSLNAHSVGNDGTDTQHDTAQKRFGATSILFDGTDDYLTSADSAEWQLGIGTSPFTLDFWVRFNALPSSGNVMGLFEQYKDASDNWKFYLDNTGGTYTLKFVQEESASDTISIASNSLSIQTAKWYHIALIRGWGGGANDYAITMNGVPVGTGTDSTAIADLDVSSSLNIGKCSDPSGFFNGWMDEIRLTNGTAWWIAPFWPPTQMYDFS